jgi:hypothetical protein
VFYDRVSPCQKSSRRGFRTVFCSSNTALEFVVVVHFIQENRLEGSRLRHVFCSLCISVSLLLALDDDRPRRLFLAIVGFNITFWLVASDPRVRTISTTVGLTTLFVVLVGVFLIAHNVHNLGLSNGRFLLLSPLFAMFLAVASAPYKWHFLTQVTFICIIAQIGMGLLDVGEANHIAWMSVSAGLVGLGVLGLIAYWANDLNKWPSPD